MRRNRIRAKLISLRIGITMAKSLLKKTTLKRVPICNDQRMVTPWWRHQMETFSALLAFCAGKSPVSGELPVQTPVTRSFDVFFDLRLNKRLSKQWWDWWFETLSRPLGRHCNAGAPSFPNHALVNQYMLTTILLKIQVINPTQLFPNYVWHF